MLHNLGAVFVCGLFSLKGSVQFLFWARRFVAKIRSQAAVPLFPSQKSFPDIICHLKEIDFGVFPEVSLRWRIQKSVDIYERN